MEEAIGTYAAIGTYCCVMCSRTAAGLLLVSVTDAHEHKVLEPVAQLQAVEAELVEHPVL